MLHIPCQATAKKQSGSARFMISQNGPLTNTDSCSLSLASNETRFGQTYPCRRKASLGCTIAMGKANNITAKTDMDVERLPFCKSESNQFVLELAMVAYNILRIIANAFISIPWYNIKDRSKLIQETIKSNKAAAVAAGRQCCAHL